MEEGCFYTNDPYRQRCSKDENSVFQAFTALVKKFRKTGIPWLKTASKC